MTDEQRTGEWKLSPQVIEKTEAEAAKILADMRAGRIAAAPPSPRLGAIWYHDWLESNLPSGVQFPLGVNHWLRDPVFSDDHWLAQGDGSSMSWLDVRNIMGKERRKARHGEQLRARRHKPMPLCLIRCIHGTFQRVTPERIADWCLALSPLKESYVIAFIRAEAPSDTLIRNAGNTIATRRAGFPALIDVPGKRGASRLATRNAYMFAALSAVRERFGGGELALPIQRKDEGDWCEAVARVFTSGSRPLSAGTLRRMLDNLPKHERARISRPGRISERTNSLISAGPTPSALRRI